MPLALPAPPVDARIRAACLGDEKAKRELLNELLPRIRNLVRYLVKGDSHADDITQEAMIAVLLELPDYRGEGCFESWVDRVVTRIALAQIRKRRVQSERDTQYRSDLVAVCDGRENNEFLYRRQVVRMLDGLPLDQRHVLVLHFVFEMTVPELASLLAVPPETVRSRLRLAKGRLRNSEVLFPEEWEGAPR